MKVYRYFKFERLKEIVEKKKLYFVNPFVKWPDEKEGFLYRIAQNSNNLECIDEILSGYKYKQQIIEQLQKGGLFKDMKDGSILDWFGMRCQSWSKSRNSMEMWEHYSCNNCAVCIAVDTSKLLSLYSKNQKVEGLSVIYKNEIKISEELKQAIGRHGEFNFPFVLQSKDRKQFAFENEYRVYVLQLDSVGNFIGENHDGVYVHIDCDINDFIEEVFVHPNAPEDFVAKVEDYVSQYDIPLVR